MMDTIKRKNQSLVFSLIAAILMCKSAVFAQALPGGLKEGTKVPDTVINALPTSDGKQLRFSDFKGKIVILDFWNIYCSSCISYMPHMDSLQMEFPDKVKVILVTKNKAEEVNKLFKRIGIRAPHLLSLTNDTILNKLFPHYGEPHHVWIDPDGIYRIGTFEYNSTSNNIAKFAKEDGLMVTPKRQGTWKDDETMLKQLSGQYLSNVVAYSIFMKGMIEFTEGGGAGTIRNSDKNNFPQTFTIINATPLKLLQTAFDKDVYGYETGVLNMKVNKRMVIETADSSRLYDPFKADIEDKWRAENLWSWEIKVEPHHADDLYHTMQKELNRILPYKGVIEERTMKYIAIVKMPAGKTTLTSTDDSLAGKGKKPATFDLDSMESLTRQINYWNGSKLPVIDESGIKGPFRIKIKVKDLVYLAALKTALNAEGLTIIEKTGPIKMLVIKDNGPLPN